MVKPGEPDPDRGVRFLVKLLASDPAGLDVATDEEVGAMLAKADLPEAAPDTAEELLARAKRRVEARAGGRGEPRWRATTWRN